MDAIDQFKQNQKQVWAGFAAMENFTAMAAPRLVRFAKVQRGANVLDLACGTGVVALAAARVGAKVTGIDLTELFTGRMFAMMQKYAPGAPPPGVAPPPQWGDPNVVRERLGSAVKDLTFDRELLRFPMLSPVHGRIFMEQSVGPVTRMVKALASDATKLAALRRDFEELITIYFEDGYMRQDFLLSRALKS